MGYADDFSQQKSLAKYNSNALLLYALQLRCGITDIDSVAAEALIDGSDDKKCDLLYIDQEAGLAVIAQGYMRQNIDGDSKAKSNKASDLNTASGWVFCRDISEVPERIRDAFANLRAEIDKGNIHTINFWYVHNCPESENVKQEMITVGRQAQITVDQVYPEKNIAIVALEVGVETLDKWFDSTKRVIVVDDEIVFPLSCGHFELEGEKWTACQTCISGKQLYQLCKTYGDDLFSANPRRFLGIDRKSKIRMINEGIQTSARSTPKDFWAYNNGITGITNKYSIDKDAIKCKGLSIINGAQTSGAISSMAEEPNEHLVISLRIVMCSDQDIIKAIIENNNKQNDMLPSDFRSNDNNQKRLRQEFAKYTSYYYSGGLRNNETTRGKEAFDHLLVGQVLKAYNGDPTEAYNEKTNIWREDQMYSSVFVDTLTAEHIIFVYSLSKAIDQIKQDLKEKIKSGVITTPEENQYNFLVKRGTRILLLAAIAAKLEVFIGRKIFTPNLLSFKKSDDFPQCVKHWLPLIKVALPFYSLLEPALSAGGISNKEKVKAAIDSLGSSLEAVIIGAPNVREGFKDFIDNLAQ